MHQFTITKEIKNLDISEIKQNLFYYKYDNKRLKSLIKRKEPKDSVSYLSAYSSFVGEIFENVIYELLLKYAKNNPLITKFILKGPHQHRENRYLKSGLLIDKSAQIVYKSAYKDISEYDAMFFTKDSIYFVEMSTSKKTASLNKRLHKKQALLKLLFPSFKIRALIVLTEGSIGIKRFPNYCTVWVTKDFTDEKLLNDLLYSKPEKKRLPYIDDKRFLQTHHIKYRKFQYFQTLEWILNKSREKKPYAIDLSFFTTKVLGLYFDVFTKLYVGYLSAENFFKMVPSYDKTSLKMVFVSLEKINNTTYDFVYYVKHENGKLYRVFVLEEDVSVKEKEQEGFTNAEVRFMFHILNEEHELDLKQIAQTRKLIPKFLK